MTTTPTSGAADLPEALIGAIMAAAYDFRDAHISGSKNLKRTAHAELESTVRNTLHALAVGQALSAAPAEQQATQETSGGFHVWRDISTAPKDGSRFVAIGYNYGLYSEGRHICVAQWFRGCWMETSDWNEASELQHLTHWLPLPSPPDDVAAPAEQQAAPKVAPAWEHHARKLTQWLHCMSHNDSYFGEPAGLVKQVTGELNRLIGAAPQPVAQQGAADGFFLLLPQRPKPEAPAGTAGLDWDAYSGAQMLAFGRDCSDAAIAALRTQQPAPAPAPAPLSERDAFEVAWEKLHGKRPVLWSRVFAEHKMETPSHSEGKYFARDEQAAWKLWQARAALAAQGGK